MEKNWQLIGLALMSTLLIFGPACPVASADKYPAIAEPVYPDSLSQVRGFHEDFAKPGSSIKLGIQSTDDLSRSATSDFSLSDATGVSLFDDSEDEERLEAVVAINTERRRTVTSNGQFQAAPTDINYMDIDVRNIIVISINTAKGGNAIATSEIFIEPVQRSSGSP
ncbi:hypothetical protein [Methanocrinis sp.]|uniref:hypothetical protein n=1 Tax=Methanocrinis sp. TaxID=3101522 RepID=UPI003D0F3EF2